ncbi:hypothetical protein F5878DRAFT_407389 [Lentinula raphanica]|uniref:Secreted protein n=1 Tax=Lentinula raphanica TaxID=153919 RepID=A0AA38UIA6_9AGAR|nr:hypothetical protein F5878DRAFT_407389 [Lentinula raphanica]
MRSIAMNLLFQVGLILLVSTLVMASRPTVYVRRRWYSDEDLACIKTGIRAIAQQKGRDWGFPSQEVRVKVLDNTSATTDENNNLYSNVYTECPPNHDVQRTGSIGLITLDSSGEEPILTMENNKGEKLTIGGKDSDMQLQKNKEGRWKAVKKIQTQQSDSGKSSTTHTSQSESD